MRFIEGYSLKEAIAEFHADPQPKRDPVLFLARLRDLLRRLINVCDRIAYADSRGVLHRDIKPANIMLGPHGESLVVDWGLAKPMDPRGELVGEIQPASEPATPRQARSTTLRGSGSSGLIRLSATASSRELTLQGEMLGTPAYASPKQVTGQLDRIGPATDVYGLGATLYTILTGRAPVDEPQLQDVLRKVRNGDITPPRAIDPRIPRPLAAIAMKALALEPSESHASAQ